MRLSAQSWQYSKTERRLRVSTMTNYDDDDDDDDGGGGGGSL